MAITQGAATPVILVSPVSVRLPLGQVATFTVTATSLFGISYQWLKEGIPIPNATGSLLSVGPTTSSDAGRYAVAVSDTSGSVTSSVAILALDAPPTVTVLTPLQQTVALGGNVIFDVAVAGSGPFTFQWYFNNQAIPDGTNQTLKLQQVTAGEEGRYQVLVRNSAGGTPSDPMTLKVLAPPVITWATPSQSVLLGSSVTLSVIVDGTPPFSFQWFFNNQPLKDETNQNLLVPRMTATSEGKYQVVVSNAVGGAQSDLIGLSVAAQILPPVIMSATASQEVPLGDNVTFGVTVGGTAPFSFQWYFSDSAGQRRLLQDQTNQVLHLPKVTTSDQGFYQVVVTNAAGSAASDLMALNVVLPPVIVSQPADQRAPAGGSVSFTSDAQGSQPLSYQWFFKPNGGSNIVAVPGGTNATLTIPQVKLRDAGSYAYVVRNSAGSATSQFAQLTVDLVPLPFADNFAAAGIVRASYFAGSGSTVGATREPGEPLHDGKRTAHTVWLTWVAPAGGIVSLSTVGSSFDTVLAVYSGDGYANIVPIESDDDSGAGGASMLRFNAVAGVTYHIVVAGYYLAEGQASLELDLTPTLDLLPRLVAQPRSVSVRESDPACLDVTSADANVQIQWLTKLGPVANATANTYCIPAVTEDTVGTYYVRVATPTQFIESHRVDVQINSRGYVNVFARDKFADALDSAQFIQPDAFPVLPGVKSVRRKDGGSGSRGYSTTQIFSTVGSGSEPGEPVHCGIGAGHSQWFAYQAETNGTLRIDTDGSNFDTVLAVYVGPGDSYSTLTNVACDNNSGLDGKDSMVRFQATAGTIYYIAVDGVTGVSPSSGTVKLHINLGSPVTVAQQPQSLTVTNGNNAQFLALASGMTNYSFQWRFNGSALPGVTNSTCTRSNVAAPMAGQYDVVISNPINSVTSQVAVLTILSSTINISTQPQSQTVSAGTNLTLSVVASGAGTLDYQWRLNGVNLPGATASTLPLNNVQPPDAGNYDVVITDANGLRASATAVLNVVVGPAFTLHPLSQTVPPGATVTLVSVATGIPLPALHWFRNNAFTGVSGTSLVITGFQAADEGIYSLRATNVAGIVFSDAAELYLRTVPRFTNTVRSNGIATMKLIATANTNYVFQATTNFDVWTTLATNASPSGILTFVDTNAGAFSHRFYRAVAP